MVADTITSLISSGALPSFVGSTVAGYCMGFVLNKILKWVLIATGFLVGIFFIVLQLMQKYGYVSPVNWAKLGNDTSVQVQHWAANIDLSNGIFNTLGIPVTSGLGIGLVAGFMRTH